MYESVTAGERDTKKSSKIIIRSLNSITFATSIIKLSNLALLGMKPNATLQMFFIAIIRSSFCAVFLHLGGSILAHDVQLVFSHGPP